MLSELIVKDLGVIEHAEVDFEQGSIALTGETGAGKTLVVAAVGLLLGDRADRSLVRAGAKRAQVEGRFIVDARHPVRSVLERNDLIDVATDPLEICVSRVIEAEGGTGKARINGHLVTLSVVAEVCGTLIEIAGQHAHHRITKQSWQQSLFDALAGPGTEQAAFEVRETVVRAREATKKAAELEAGQRERARESDILSTEIAEIEALGLKVGESAELQAAAARLEHAEGLAEGCSSAADRLRGEAGVEELLAAAERILEPLVEHDAELMPSLERMRSLRLEAADIAGDLRARTPNDDPGALNETRARLDTIARAIRKYGADEAAILEYLVTARRRWNELEEQDDSGTRIAAAAAALNSEAHAAAAALTSLRTAAKTRVGESVEAWLGQLALERSSFEIELSSCDLNEGGAERVGFLLSTNPGTPVAPVTKVASGGELARVGLALRLAAGNWSDSTVRTMIFDEVDSGVGGEAARSVGRCLAELAASAGVQVLVVTHLPQVAAQADQHLFVSKGSDDSVTKATVVPLDHDARVAELSRMLAGMPKSERAQEHARELLAEAVAR